MSSRGNNQSSRQASARPAPGSTVAWARSLSDPSQIQSFEGGGKKADPAMNLLASELGYDKPARSVSTAALDRMISQTGAQEVWRGATSEMRTGEKPGAAQARATAYAKAVTKGAYHAGFGLYGSGIYVGHGPDARSIADTYARGVGSRQPLRGVVMRGAIAPSARVGNAISLRQQMRQDGARFVFSKGAQSAYELSRGDRGEYNLLYTDVGRYAATKGYDVITGMAGEFWTVLNRGVLVADRTLYQPGPGE